MSFKLKAVNIKRVVLGDVTPCGLRHAYQRCGATLHNPPPPMYRTKYEGGGIPKCQVFTAFMLRIPVVR